MSVCMCVHACVCVCACVGVNLGTVEVLDGRDSRVAVAPSQRHQMVRFICVVYTGVVTKGTGKTPGGTFLYSMCGSVDTLTCVCVHKINRSCNSWCRQWRHSMV